MEQEIIKGYRNSLIVLIVIVTVMVLNQGCENNEPAVKSPFSHLDTVKTKPVEQEKKEEKKEGDGTTFSPFSNIDKK